MIETISNLSFIEILLGLLLVGGVAYQLKMNWKVKNNRNGQPIRAEYIPRKAKHPQQMKRVERKLTPEQVESLVDILMEKQR